jgi:hypothetical protein
MPEKLRFLACGIANSEQSRGSLDRENYDCSYENTGGDIVSAEIPSISLDMQRQYVNAWRW